MKLYPLLSLIAGAICLSFAAIVIIKGKENKKNRSFFIATVLTGIWTLFPFLTNLVKNNDSALFITRFLYLFAAFVPTAWYYFMADFLELKIKPSKTAFLVGVSLFFACLSFTPMFIKDVVRFAPNFYPKAGPIYFLFIIYFSLVFSEIMFKLFKAFKNANGYIKSQILYVCSAYAAGALSGTLHFFSAYTGKEPLSHDIFIILYPMILAYTITKYRFLDIKVLITRTGIFVAVYTLVLGLPFLLTFIYKNRLIAWQGPNWWALPFTLMAMLATVGPFLYIYLQKRAEAIILREQHSYQETLHDIAAGMTRIHNLNKLLSLIVESVITNVGVSHIAVYLSNGSSGQLILKAGKNLAKDQPGSIGRNNLLISWLDEHKESLIYEEAKRKFVENPKSVFKDLESQMRFLNASVIVPNFLDDKLLGFFVLGEKHSRRMYTSEDLQIFSVLASQSALAIENALLYENIEEQVKSRTEELVEVQKQLVHAEKLATVGTLAGGVAHEINNPLTAILTNVQMLLSGDELDKESLEMIEEATKRCKIIVQKLMAFAKKPLESSMMYNFNILEVIQRTVDFLKFQLEQENITIGLKADKGSYQILGNHNELEQVLTNILLNARDAIKQVKKSGKISITVSDDGNMVKIRIEDEGSGIPKEILSRIFDPFFTTKEVGKGLGLGLSICQTIIEKHKGKITVDSELYKGSIFTLLLPKFKEKS